MEHSAEADLKRIWELIRKEHTAVLHGAGGKARNHTDLALHS